MAPARMATASRLVSLTTTSARTISSTTSPKMEKLVRHEAALWLSSVSPGVGREPPEERRVPHGVADGRRRQEQHDTDQKKLQRVEPRFGLQDQPKQNQGRAAGVGQTAGMKPREDVRKAHHAECARHHQQAAGDKGDPARNVNQNVFKVRLQGGRT